MRNQTWIAGLCAVGLLGLATTAHAAPNKKKVMKAMMASDDAKELIKVVDDKDGAAQIVEDIYDYWVKDSMDNAKAKEQVGAYLEFEVKRLKGSWERLEELRKLRQKNKLWEKVEGKLMAVGDYGADGGDDDALKASKWINNASTSTRGNRGEITATEKILERFAKKNDVRSLADLSALNKVLVDDKGMAKYRAMIDPAKKYASSTGGYYLLARALKLVKKKESGRNLAAFVYGAIVRCHPFTDGNGRTARAAYAIALLKAERDFEGMTIEAENWLHALDD